MFNEELMDVIVDLLNGENIEEIIELIDDISDNIAPIANHIIKKIIIAEDALTESGYYEALARSRRKAYCCYIDQGFSQKEAITLMLNDIADTKEKIGRARISKK